MKAQFRVAGGGEGEGSAVESSCAAAFFSLGFFFLGGWGGGEKAKGVGIAWTCLVAASFEEHGKGIDAPRPWSFCFAFHSSSG